MSVFDIETDQKEVKADISLKDLYRHDKLEKQTLVEGERELSIPLTLAKENIKHYDMLPLDSNGRKQLLYEIRIWESCRYRKY